MYKGTDYIHLPGSQKVLIPGTGVTFTKTYGAGVLGNGTEEHRIDASGGATCPLPMTRAALITLRNASGLLKDCDYVITDHVQGRLVAGTQIHLQAVSANELSESVAVNTTYDNEAWAGIYDLDRGLVLELTDNRGNVAKGFTGAEVSNFDWGNSSITNTTVESATWTSTIGSARLVSNLRVFDGANLNTLGQTGGVITNSEVRGQSTVNTSLANVSLVNFNVSDNSNVNLASFTAGSSLTNYYIKNSSVNFSNSSSGVSLTGVNRIEGSTITHSGVSSGAISGAALTVVDGSIINHSQGASTLSFNRTKIKNSNINHSQGSITLSGQKILDGSTISQITGTGGVISLTNGTISDNSQITNQGAYLVSGSRLRLNDTSSILIANGAVGTLSAISSKLSTTSSINITATSTAGNLVLNNSELRSNTFFTKSGTGPMQVSGTEFTSNSRFTVSSSRGLIITRGVFNDLTQVIQSGTGAVSDQLIDSFGTERAFYGLSSTGAAAHTLNYAHVSGLGGNFNVAGTSTGQIVNRLNAISSTINLNSNIGNTFNNMTAMDGSTINFQNMTVAKAANNVQCFNASFITVNNPTGAGGAITTIKAENASTVNINTAAVSSNNLVARDGGVITQNGGSSTRVTKQMSGTLTTGNFNHVDVVCIDNANVTMTANNTSRSRLLGVASTSPIV